SSSAVTVVKYMRIPLQINREVLLLASSPLFTQVCRGILRDLWNLFPDLVHFCPHAIEEVVHFLEIELNRLLVHVARNPKDRNVWWDIYRDVLAVLDIEQLFEGEYRFCMAALFL